MCGSFPWTNACVNMRLSPAISASRLALIGALTHSYVQPLGPAADLWGTLSSILTKNPEDIWAWHSFVAGCCGASSCGCKSSTSSVIVASGNSCRAPTATEMLPSCSWQWMCRLCWWCMRLLRKPAPGRLSGGSPRICSSTSGLPRSARSRRATVGRASPWPKASVLCAVELTTCRLPLVQHWVPPA
jgi:hypothetical protein